MNGIHGLPHSSPFKSLERQRTQGWLPRGWIDGLILSNDGTDATNDIAIAAGCARSTVSVVDGVPSTLARDQIDMDLPVGIVKQLDVAWAPDNYDPQASSSGGDRSGGKSASSLANGTWHVYLIGGRSVPADVLFHDSAAQSSIVTALPAGYSAYRMIGSILRESAAIVAFNQVGDRFDRAGSVLDVNTANPGTSAVANTLSVPTGIAVESIVQVGIKNATNSTIIYSVFRASDQTDETPSISNSDITPVLAAAGAVSEAYGVLRIRTNTSGQIRSRLSFSDGNTTQRIRTLGWLHPRGKNI